MDPEIIQAFRLACKVLHGRKRLTNRSAVLHSVEVSEIVEQMGYSQPSYRRVGLLHDTKEDGSLDHKILEQRMRQAGCTEPEIKSIDRLSHFNGHSTYIGEYVLRLVPHSLDRVIKIADNIHNLHEEPIPEPLMTDRKRYKRVLQAQSLGGLLMAHREVGGVATEAGWIDEMLERTFSLPEAELIDWKETELLFLHQLEEGILSATE